MLKTILSVTLATTVGTAALAQDAMFGTDEDTAFAAELWQALTDAGLEGPSAPLIFPYAGAEPHGFQLSTLYATVNVGGRDGVAVVKRNYGPEGVSADEVLGDPAKHLAAVTVMFKREDGYDDATGNWFYAKYLPDGALDMNPKGMALAGLVGKDADAGCIACHQNAGGDDYLFTTDADLSAAMMMQ